jgi:hypothetical protein
MCRGPVSAITSAIVLIGLAAAGRAEAETSADDKALATVLFKEGRALMAEGRLALACPKFEESHRLDPGGGTILNLALCHEQEGLLARSWSELNEAAAFARRDRRPDREAMAVEHARALEPRLSTLTIVVPASARMEGLRIERDGREVGQASWSTAMPVDGGDHVVRATAPGKQPFASTVVVGKEGDAHTVEIPPLQAIAAVVAPAATSASATVVAPLVDRGPAPTNRRRTLAWTVGGAGLAQLGIAGYFALRAADKRHQSDLACPDGRCDQRGVQLNDEAGRAADVATVLTITGLASVATGIYLLATSRRAPTLQVAISGHASMVGLQGSF